jgi:hypothetical protein
LAWCVCTQAQTNEIIFQDEPAGISLRLPVGWIAFPPEMLHRVAGLGAKLEPVLPPRQIRAVFQRGTNINEPAFPRIVIHVQTNASVGEQQFRNLHAAPLVEITVAQALGFPGRAVFMKSARYDSGSQCLAFDFDCYIEDVGYFRACGRSFLTANGLVNVYGYAPAGDFAAFEPEFKKIVATFQVSPGHRFLPGSGKPEVQDSGFLWKAAGVIGLMLAAPVVWFFSLSRFRRDIVYSDEI